MLISDYTINNANYKVENEVSTTSKEQEKKTNRKQSKRVCCTNSWKEGGSVNPFSVFVIHFLCVCVCAATSWMLFWKTAQPHSIVLPSLNMLFCLQIFVRRLFFRQAIFEMWLHFLVEKTKTFTHHLMICQKSMKITHWLCFQRKSTLKWIVLSMHAVNLNGTFACKAENHSNNITKIRVNAKMDLITNNPKIQTFHNGMHITKVTLKMRNNDIIYSWQIEFQSYIHCIFLIAQYHRNFNGKSDNTLTDHFVILFWGFSSVCFSFTTIVWLTQIQILNFIQLKHRSLIFVHACTIPSMNSRVRTTVQCTHIHNHQTTIHNYLLNKSYCHTVTQSHTNSFYCNRRKRNMRILFNCTIKTNYSTTLPIWLITQSNPFNNTTAKYSTMSKPQ